MKRIPKQFSFLISALFIPLFACGILDQSDEKVVIRVGDRKVTSQELIRDIKYVTSGMGIMNQGTDRITDPLIDKMVDHYLIVEFGKKNGITLLDGELESAVREIKADYPDEVFEEMLLHRYVDFEEWKDILRQQLYIKKIVQTVTEDITPITSKEIKTYFDTHTEEFKRSKSVKFWQIVTSTRSEAKKVRKQLLGGGDREALARAHSTTPEAENGGVVGWVSAGELEESMEKVIFSLPASKISPVVKTAYGYHIFLVLSKSPGGMKTLPEAMGEIETKLYQQKQASYSEKWLKDLREIFPVTVNQEILKELEFG